MDEEEGGAAPIQGIKEWARLSPNHKMKGRGWLPPTQGMKGEGKVASP